MRVLFLAASLAAILASSSAYADEPDFPPELRALIERDPEAALERLTSVFNHITQTGEVTFAQLQTLRERELARIRAMTFSHALTFDFNGDLHVDADELGRVFDSGNRREVNAVTRFLEDYDVDGDGAVTPHEASIRAERAVDEHDEDYVQQSAQFGSLSLFYFDENGDGTITLPEMTGIIIEIQSAFLEAQQATSELEAVEQAIAQNCTLPEPGENAQLVLVGAYQGAALATAAIGALDRETTLARVEIEEGDGPIYLVVAALIDTIVEIGGATHRLERVVGSSLHREIGFSGVDAQKITFAASDCALRYFTDVEDARAAQAEAQVALRTGVRVDHVAASASLGTLVVGGEEPEVVGAGVGTDTDRDAMRIVSGTTEFVMERDGSVRQVGRSSAMVRMMNELMRFYPGGIANVDPENVVSSSRQVEPYEVLPQQAGILQLFKDGSLSNTPDGHISIDQPIAHFPAGLTGGHAVQFILREGVPMPAGSPGHSSVIIEETGECMGSRC